jgi:hypothetical protein
MARFSNCGKLLKLKLPLNMSDHVAEPQGNLVKVHLFDFDEYQKDVWAW